MRRLAANLLLALARAFSGRSYRVSEGLTAVEYEAVTLIAYEGHDAYARACEQADYCRRRGSKEGRIFWSQVATEITLRTKGRMPERR